MLGEDTVIWEQDGIVHSWKMLVLCGAWYESMPAISTLIKARNVVGVRNLVG